MAKSKEFVRSSRPERSSRESLRVRTIPDRVLANRSAAPSDDDDLIGDTSRIVNSFLPRRCATCAINALMLDSES
eukprot:948536-Heterocapsa_arctica.AAC.1